MRKNRQGRSADRLDEAGGGYSQSRPGLAPFPGAFFEAELGKGVERVKVLRTQITQEAGAPATSSARI